MLAEKGFTLIEILVAITCSTILFLALFSSVTSMLTWMGRLNVGDHEEVRDFELAPGWGQGSADGESWAAIRRQGSDFSLQVTGVPLGKRSLEQLLNDGDKVVERTNRGEGMGVLGTQYTTCCCQQKRIYYSGERDLAVVELPGQAAVGWSRSRRCIGQSQIGSQHGLDVSSPLQGGAQSCLRRAAASCSLSRRR